MNIDDEPDKLPPGAGDWDAPRFEPNSEWLKSATAGEQKAAMRRWFTDRYEDPANEMPWDGEDKAYIFPWGGPYDPSHEIQGRFGDLVPFEVMWDLIQEFHAKVGDEWAPIDHEIDYEEDFTLAPNERGDPLRFLTERLNQIDQVMAVAASLSTKLLICQMAHGSIIAALEAYLADTLSFWTSVSQSALKRFVSTNKDFQSRSFKASEIFERYNSIPDDVKSYLQAQVWHRLDKVKPMMEAALQIAVPPIDELMQDVILRHDIVHRAGKSEEGIPVVVQPFDVFALRDRVSAFALAIEKELFKSYPSDRKPDFIEI